MGDTKRPRGALHGALALWLLSSPLVPAVITVGGDCSLSEAITAANDDLPVGGCDAGDGADEIRLTGDAPLVAALPAIAAGSEIIVRGNGFAIERQPGAQEFRIFDVPDGGALTIDNAVISGGIAAHGGGIHSLGDLTIVNSTVSSNVATGIFGGGIFNQGQLTLIDSTVSNNSAGYAGGGVDSEGATTVIVDSSLRANHAEHQGGAIRQYGGTLTVRGSTLSGNTVTGGSSGPGHNAGGGLWISPGGLAASTLTNTTVSGNLVGQGNGGGIFLYYGELTLTNTTVAGNRAPGGSALFQYYGETTLDGSVVSGECEWFGEPFHGSASFGCDFDELTGLDEVLASNGGPTPTHALLAGSSAIDAFGTCAESADQRGFVRAGECDSGAYEFEGVGAPVGGASVGLGTRRATCSNRTAGIRFDLALNGASDWDCETAGLPVAAGDLVEQSVVGEALAAAAIAGSVFGMRLQQTTCSNLSSGGRRAVVPAGLATTWDCTATGLEIAAGDRIRVTVRGRAD